jgi:hypothetical protein
VFGDLLKRVVNLVVIVLAGLAFFLVPIGGKTSAGHVEAILSTRPARQAGAAFAATARRLLARAMNELDALRGRRAPASQDDRP